jgi:hypothetical protein
VNRFTEAWQKRLTILNQTKKSQNLIDADSELTHVSESSLQVTSFVSALAFLEFGEKRQCITASISSRLHLSL